jgi:multicomponent Na+:H+ antiporter subunit C
MSSYLIIILFLIGLGGLLFHPNIIKKVIALNILSTAGILLFLYSGSSSGSTAPILVGMDGKIVDPLPQALMLTAIVVGVCVTALSLVLVIRLFRIHGTLDIREIEKQQAEADE